MANLARTKWKKGITEEERAKRSAGAKKRWENYYKKKAEERI